MNKLIIVGCMSASLILSACTSNQTDSAKTTGTEISLLAGESSPSKEFDLSTDLSYEKYVTLGEYKGIKVAKVSAEVKDTEVEEQIQQLLDSYAEVGQVTDRAIVDGDTVNLDFEGFLDGEAFEGGAGQDFDLTIGSGRFIEGFEAGLVGAMPQTTVDLPLTFPQDYQSQDLAGKDVVFKVTINYIQGEKTIPAFTDEWIKEKGIADSAQAYRDEVKTQLQAEKESTAKQQEQSAIDEQIIQNATFTDYPKARQEKEEYNLRLTCEGYAKQMNTTVEQIIQALYNRTAEEVTKDYIERIVVYTAIAKAENIEVKQEDLDEFYSGYSEEQQKEMQEKYPQDEINEYLLMEKVSAFILENSVIE
ncbi:trigger factor [Clostridia bacterium]|nr:trigger factor [Clostridia bacterium]